MTKDAVDAGVHAVGAGRASPSCIGDVPGDSVAAHVEDTLAAGGGLCDPAAVAAIVRDGPPRWRGCARGARCSTRPRPRRTAGRSAARTREGGHTAFRVVHAGGDATGAEIERALVAAARAAADRCSPGTSRSTCCRDERGRASAGPGGARRRRPTGRAARARGAARDAAATASCTPRTTNPETATGDGVALALRAGAAAADLEFVQFHPTVLYTVRATGRRPLVTEAVRGEGAVLLRPGRAPVHDRRAPARRPRAPRRRGGGDHPPHGRDRAPTACTWTRPRAGRLADAVPDRVTRPAGRPASTRPRARSR